MLESLLILFSISPLLPLIPLEHWTIQFFDFVRVQTSVIQLFLILLALFFWKNPTSLQYLFIVFSIGVLIYQSSLIWPYTPFYPKKKSNGPFYNNTLKLITANVLQDNTNYDKFETLIRKSNPDIFVTMESDENWDNHISKAFPEYIHTLKATLSNYYGMHIYSKIAFESSEIFFLVEEDVPSMHCEIFYANQLFDFKVLHPAPPSPTENKTSKERDAELMIVGKQCRENRRATIVCGDLNDVIWSKTSRLFKKMTGYLDPRLGRGLYPSFHANYWLLRFPLDHLFYSTDLHVSTIERLEPFGSDHFAMYYEINFPLKENKNEIPDLSLQEKDEIEIIIKNGQ